MVHMTRWSVVLVWLIVLVWACALTAGAAGGAPGPDPASVVPQDAVVYTELSPDAGQKLLSVAALPPVAGLFIPTQQSPFGYLDEALGLFPGTVQKAAPHLRSAAFCVTGDAPLLVLAFDEEHWAGNLIQGLPRQPDGTSSLPGGEAAAVTRGAFLGIGASAACVRLARGDYAPLASNPNFVAAKADVAAKTAGAAVPLWAYVAVADIVKAASGPSAGHDAQEFAAFAKASGLDRARYGVAVLRSGQGAAGLEADLRFQGDDVQLLRLIPQTTLAISADVPADPAAALLVNWLDASVFFGGVRELAFKVSEATGDLTLHARLADMEQNLGFTFDQLLSQIGSGAAVYLPQPAPGTLLSRQGWTAVLRLKDAKGFEDSLGKVMMRGPSQAPAQMAFEGKPMRQLPGLPVFYSTTPDRMVLGGSPAAVKAYLDWQADAQRQTMRNSVGERPAAALAWADLGLLLKSYPAPKPDGKAVVALSRGPERLRLTAGLEGIEPGQFPQYTAAYPAIMAAMLMPALSRARGEARSSMGKANLHNIGLGIAMYAADHDGAYPPNLQEVLRLGYLDSPNVFLDPMDAAPRPLEPGGPPCSYEYVGPIPGTVPAGLIIVYERKGMNPNGRSLLHVDMSVDQATEAQLHNAAGDMRTSLRASYEAVVKAFGNTLTDERKTELRKFYEVQD